MTIMTDEHTRLEERIRDAADHVDWPAERDISGSVRRRLEHPRRPALRPWPRSAVAAAVGLALVAVVFLVPAGRRAVADLLGVAGIDISMTTETARPGGELDLGAPLSLAAAVDSVPYPVLRPTVEGVGEPSSVFVSEVPSDGLWMAWEPDAVLPEVSDSGVGLLLLQFRAEVAAGGFRKQLGPGTTVEEVAVGDSSGFWIEGAPHDIAYVTADGETVGEWSRLAGNVLVWERDRTTYRLESALDRDATIHIAESMAPADP